MVPHGLILRMHEAAACADLLGVLFPQDRAIFERFLMKIMDFRNLGGVPIPDGGAHVQKDIRQVAKLAFRNANFATLDNSGPQIN